MVGRTPAYICKPLSIDHRSRFVAAEGMSRRGAAQRFGVSAASDVRGVEATNTTGSVEGQSARRRHALASDRGLQRYDPRGHCRAEGHHSLQLQRHVGGHLGKGEEPCVLASCQAHMVNQMTVEPRRRESALSPLAQAYWINTGKDKGREPFEHKRPSLRSRLHPNGLGRVRGATLE